MPVQSSRPPQSPVMQEPLPLLSNVQLVLPQIRPSQFVATVRLREVLLDSSNPFVLGPLPPCVFSAGHIESLQLLVIVRVTCDCAWAVLIATANRREISRVLKPFIACAPEIHVDKRGEASEGWLRPQSTSPSNLLCNLVSA